MAAQQRKLLEQLMGSIEGPSEIDFSDPKLCKSFCVRFCVTDIFNGTKASLGRCPYVHIERAHMQYKSLETKIPSFEREFDRSLMKTASIVKRRISVAEQNLELESQDDVHSARLREEISVLCEELTSAGRAGQINSETASKLKELEMKRAELKKIESSAQPKLQVCRVCASYLSPAESDRRLADHFMGKIHRAYAEVLDVIEERQHKRKECVTHEQS